MSVRYQSNRRLESSFKHQDAESFYLVSQMFNRNLYTLAMLYLLKHFYIFSYKGFQEFLPQLVDQMASSTLKLDVKDQNISYEVIRVEDEIEVLRLLRATFFKVNSVPSPKFFPLPVVSMYFRSVPNSDVFLFAQNKGKSISITRGRQKEMIKFFFSTKFPSS